jgi:hypothetical protein
MSQIKNHSNPSDRTPAILVVILHALQECRRSCRIQKANGEVTAVISREQVLDARNINIKELCATQHKGALHAWR